MALKYKNMFKKLKKELEEISSEWNGDEPGIAEDRCHTAEEAIKQITKLEELLKELNI